MMIRTAEALVVAVRENRLLEEEQLAQLLQPPNNRFADARALAKHLIQQGWMTPFQINQIMIGKGQELVMGQYVLLERLGEGGMGKVFKARHLHLHRVVALKVVRQEHLAHSEAIRRFHREIRAAASLSHPNVVLAYDADRVGTSHFFVMEYVEGVDLSTLLKKCGPAPTVALACDIIRQAALGLQHAFERGMVHRDIKPANLLLTRAPETAGRATPVEPLSPPPVAWITQGAQLKILDMGLARIQQGDEQEMSAITKEGRVVGTPDYMSPEQAVNPHTADIRADLYSLGCTFYHVLTGQVPFKGGTMMEKLLHHRFDMPQPVEQLRPEAPPAVAQIVTKLLAKNPNDRFQTPGDLAGALAEGNSTGAFVPLAKVVEVDTVETPAFRTPTSASPWEQLNDARPPSARTAVRATRRWLFFLILGLVGLFTLLMAFVVGTLWFRFNKSQSELSVPLRTWACNDDVDCDGFPGDESVAVAI
jgi:serine/threonine-protein kinase